MGFISLVLQGQADLTFISADDVSVVQCHGEGTVIYLKSCTTRYFTDARPTSVLAAVQGARKRGETVRAD